MRRSPTTEEWECIRTLGEQFVRSLDSLGEDAARNEILKCVSFLIEKYGSVPALLATKADYVENADQALLLLHNAYAAAVEQCDTEETIRICSSIVDLYLDSKKNIGEAKVWAAKLEEWLALSSDDIEREHLATIKKRLSSD